MSGSYLTTGTRGQKHLVPDVASDTICLIGATQTLTNKTWTSPAITGATITGGTSTALRPVQSVVLDSTIPVVAGVTVLNHAAHAGTGYTLAAPVDVTDDGLEMIITTGTAYAHVITATNLVQDGTTGNHTTITFTAYIGSTVHLVAYNALWFVVATSGITSIA